MESNSSSDPAVAAVHCLWCVLPACSFSAVVIALPKASSQQESVTV